MALEAFTNLPLTIDPTSKVVSSTHSDQSVQDELTQLNTLHRTLVKLDNQAHVPPPPVPVNPKLSAAIAKLRQSANSQIHKNSDEAIRLYTFAIKMALERPPWELAGLVRDELATLYSNRAQAYMGSQRWAEGWIDAQSSVECKRAGNCKAYWRGGKCLAEMGRWEEAHDWVVVALEREKGLQGPPGQDEGVKELEELKKEAFARRS